MRTILDGDQAVEDLGNLLFEQPLEELVGRARENDARLVVVHLDRLDDGLDRVALAVEVVGNLLGLGKDQLVLLVVEDEHLPLPDLIDFARHDLADLLRVLLVEAGLLQVEDARGEVLPQRQHRAAAERRELDLVGVFVADLVGRVDGLHLRHGDLHVGILHGAVLHDGPVAPDFEVALLGVDDDVEILVRFVLFLKRVAEDVLQYADHRRFVDVLQLFELGKVADQIQVVHCVLIICLCIFRSFACRPAPQAAGRYLKSSHSFVYLICAKGYERVTFTGCLRFLPSTACFSS